MSDAHDDSTSTPPVPPPGNDPSADEPIPSPDAGQENTDDHQASSVEPNNPIEDERFNRLIEGLLGQVGRANQAFNNSGGTTNVGSTVIHIGTPKVSDYQSPANDPGIAFEYDTAEHNAVFVATEALKIARNTLLDRQVVVISGRSGSGRRTLACALIGWMQELYPDWEVRQLASHAALTGLDETAFQEVVEQRVYLIVLESGDRISQANLEKLIARIQQKKSYLILVCGDDAFMPLQQTSPILLTGVAVPDPAEVFARHVRRQLVKRDRDDQIGANTTALSALQSSEAMVRVLRQAPDLRRVTELAGKVAEWLIAGWSLADIVQAAGDFSSTWLATCAREHILEAKHSRVQLCLLIAAAVLVNVPIDEFWPLAERLRMLMDEQFSREDREHWQYLKRMPSSDWLAAARARVERQAEWYENRKIWLDVIGSDPPELGFYLISAFWREYQQERGKLRAWLLELGEDIHLPWRARVAITFTVGVLLLQSPDWLDEAIIRHWLLNEAFLPQENGALAIRFAAEEDAAVARQWLNRLAAWVRDNQSRPRLIFASALIYAWLSINEPEAFVQGMDRLVAGPDAWVLTVHTRDNQTTIEGREQRQPALRFAFVRAMQLGGFKTCEHFKQLFSQLRTWSLSHRPDPRRLARHVTIILMTNYQVVEVKHEDACSTSDAHGDGLVFVPILLDILHKHKEVTSYAAGLIGHAMGAPQTTRDTRSALEVLLAFAAERQSYQPTLNYLMVQICMQHPSSEPQRTLIYNWLKGWVIRNKDNSRACYGKEVARMLRGKKLI